MEPCVCLSGWLTWGLAVEAQPEPQTTSAANVTSFATAGMAFMMPSWWRGLCTTFTRSCRSPTDERSRPKPHSLLLVPRANLRHPERAPASGLEAPRFCCFLVDSRAKDRHETAQDLMLSRMPCTSPDSSWFRGRMSRCIGKSRAYGGSRPCDGTKGRLGSAIRRARLSRASRHSAPGL